MNVANSGPKTESRDIPNSLDQLHKTIDDATDSLSRLSTRLKPALREYPQSPAPGTDKAEIIKSQIGQSILVANTRIEELIRNINRLEAEVQL